MKKVYKILGIAVLTAVIGFTFSACGGSKGGAQESGGARPSFSGPATIDSFRGDWVKKSSSGTAAKQIIVDSGFYAGNVFVFYEGPGGMGITGSFNIRDRGEVTETAGGFDFEVTGTATTTVGEKELDTALKSNWNSATKILFHLSSDGQTLTWDLDDSEFERRM
jgi:hypothetical protein